jgi:hypothetical protein
MLDAKQRVRAIAKKIFFELIRMSDATSFVWLMRRVGVHVDMEPAARSLLSKRRNLLVRE